MRRRFDLQVKALKDNHGENGTVSNNEPRLFHPTPKNDTAEPQYCLNAALLLFGVPKSFQYIWNAYLTNVIKRNPHVHFEVYMHMYSDLHQNPFSSVRSSEVNSTLESPEEIRAILYKGIPNVHLFTSSQSEFDKEELSWMNAAKYNFGKGGPGGYNEQTVKNIFRQGNSIKTVYSANASSQTYDVYIFARSDTYLLSPIDLPCSGLGEQELHVPSWHKWGGINDRFALAGPAAAKIYAAKSDAAKEAVIKYHQKNIIFGKVPHNSETVLKQFLHSNSLKVTQVEKNWAKLLRIRGGGKIHGLDRNLFGVKQRNVKDLALQPKFSEVPNLRKEDEEVNVRVSASSE
jgi:hypothetical protein